MRVFAPAAANAANCLRTRSNRALFAVRAGALALFVLVTPTSHAQNELQVPMNLVYTVTTDGARIGEYAMRISRNRNVFRLESSLTPQGIAQLFAGGLYQQESVFMITKGKILPLIYTEQREGKDPEKWSMQFDWSTMKITMPDGELVEMPRQPLDAAVAPIQVLMTPPSKSRDLSVNVVSDKGIRQHTFSRVGEVELETAIGTVNTVNIHQRKRGSEKQNYVDIWLAPDKNWIPVKIVRHKKSRSIEFNIQAYNTTTE